MRELLRVVNAHDRGKVSAIAVADHLAQLNQAVARVVHTVGSRCIVAWRHRNGGVHKGGGAQQFYSGSQRESDHAPLATIATGMDVRALVSIIARPMFERMRLRKEGEPPPIFDIDQDRLNAELALLPDKPDEDLR